jgi:hypothetical protein
MEEPMAKADSGRYTRRTLLGTGMAAAAVPVSLALPVATGSGPDPVFALIERYHAAYKRLDEVVHLKSEAQESLRRNGHLVPHVMIGDQAVYSHEVINRMLPVLPGSSDWNKRSHAQLDEEIERHSSNAATKEASEDVSNIVDELLTTSPPTLTGVAALLQFVREAEVEGEEPLCGNFGIADLCLALERALTDIAGLREPQPASGRSLRFDPEYGYVQRSMDDRVSLLS